MIDDLHAQGNRELGDVDYEGDVFAGDIRIFAYDYRMEVGKVAEKLLLAEPK